MSPTSAKQLKDNVYAIGPTGFAYSTDRAEFGFTQRHAAVVLLTTHRRPFELALSGGETLRASAAIVGPMVKRRLVSPHGHLLSFNVMPSHALFRRLARLPAPHAVAIDRQAFGEWDDLFAAMHQGTASLSSARGQIDSVLMRASDLFSPAPLSHPVQCEQLHQLLAHAPDASLARMAREMDLPPGQEMSVWQQTFGMPFRDYDFWRNHHPALKDIFYAQTQKELAQATGFRNSAQFSRAFRNWYGLPSSCVRNPEQVRVFLAG